MKTELTLTFTISDFEEHKDKDLDLDFIKMEFINNIHDSVRKKKFSDKLNKPFGTDFKVTKIRIDKW